MILRLTYLRGGHPVDLEVTLEAETTLGELAEHLVLLDPLSSRAPMSDDTLAVAANGQRAVLDPARSVAGSAVVSGATVEVVRGASPAPAERRSAPAGVVDVVGGPEGGKRFPLHRGTNVVGRGRDADIRLGDETISKVHAKLNVSDVIEIIDSNSSNGVVIGGAQVARAVVLPTDLIELGDTSIRVRLTATPDATEDASSPDPTFVRPPRITPTFSEQTLPAPEIPVTPEPQRMSMVALLAPLFMGGLLYAATKQVASLLFVLLSPIMMLGQWLESRIARGRNLRRERERFAQELSDLGRQVTGLQTEERESRCRENCTGAEAGEAIERRSDLLWSRQPSDERFLTLRLGLGTTPSRVTIELPTQGGRNIDLQGQLREFAHEQSWLDSAPIIADLRQTPVGLAGSGDAASAVARSLLLQLAGLHAPQDVTIAACTSSEGADAWDWLKWLPHTSSATSVLPTQCVVAGPGGASRLVGAIEELLAERQLADTPLHGHREAPRLVLLVTDDAPIDRGRLDLLASRGAEHGIHLLWVAPDVSRLPAACHAFVAVGSSGQARAGFVTDAVEVVPLQPDRVDLAAANRWARMLSPVVDAGHVLADESDLPRAVSFLSMADRSLGWDPSAVAERWRESESLSRHRKPGRRKAGTLRALVGQTAAGPLTIDLRADGPHALVGGTTGSGKSELLQTWVLSMAATHSPERVTFLFVDYKGGSAFGECVRLPHSVGLVTDLSPHLVRRALESLEAEVRHRERILNRAKAKDLLDMERAGHPETPPSLIIVVDEFAALVHEVPEFVDGVVNIAQRGRSLGLHLILATQRPAGVIKENLRANTNLRMALRMADAEDSTDVLGSPAAADFDPTAPGRAALRTGPGRITAFQSAYVGGYTSDEGVQREVSIRELSLVDPQPWRAEEEVDHERVARETDLQRTLSSIMGAADLEAVAPPRRPWLPELPPTLDLAHLDSDRTDAALAFGLLDEPENQSQVPCAFHPDVDGNLAVYGASGSGKSAVLRSLTVAAGFTVRGGPVHVYGLDFGARGLAMLEPLPHVGSIISGDDTERVARLLRTLRDLIAARAERFAAVNASSIRDYRRDAGRPEEPRILVLLDGLAAFRQVHDLGSGSGLFEMLNSIAADGRQVGVHLVITADRPATVPSALNSLIAKRLVLRLADDNDNSLLGVPAGLFTVKSPPGRGFLQGHEVQVAVLGGDPSGPVQAQAVQRFARAMTKNVTWPPASPVGRLSEDVRVDDLPSLQAGRPVIGMVDEDLSPATFSPEGTFVIVGPPASGRTTALQTALCAALRALPGARVAVFTPGRAPGIDLAGVPDPVVACGPDTVAELAAHVTESIRDEAGGARWVLVLENPGEFLNGSADLPLQDLLKVARAAGQLVLAEGETQSMSGSWPLLQALRFSRRGLALQPDQTDGDMVFRTGFPRLRRADFVQGRGMLVGEGRARRVQVAWSGRSRD